MGYSECATMNKSFFNFPTFYFSISLTGPESGSFHRPLVDQGSHKVCFCFIYYDYQLSKAGRKFVEKF